MPQDLKTRIISYIRTNQQARVKDLLRALSPSGRASIHRQLAKLVNDGTLEKIGKTPTVFYVLAKKKAPTETFANIPAEAKKVIDEAYLYITPQGQLLYGSEGFVAWTSSTKQISNTGNLARSYLKIVNQHSSYRKPAGYIDATFKLKETFKEANLDKLLYADFYSLPQFGKTKLGTLMLYAKQSQNRELAKQVCLSIKPLLEKIITDFKIDAVAFIPPSIPRQVQLMTELAEGINLALPRLSLVKTKTGQVIVAQKTLSRLEERVANARDTIFLKETKVPFHNILLIDDAVGSGASMNETAKKIKAALLPNGQVHKVIGFAVVGSFKGFEVIQEV